jgi:RNA polymerase sigma factor (sigma-70 family)
MVETIDWDTMSDETLVGRARDGDDEAFAVLFGRHRAYATRIARRYAVRGEAEDVVSDAFTAMLHHVRRGNGPSENVRGYLAVSVRHGASRRAKHHARTRATSDTRVVDRSVPFGHGMSDVGERELLKSALADLSARQRDVLWAVEVEGLRPREVATRLGVDANTVSAIAYRARRTLRAGYQGCE